MSKNLPSDLALTSIADGSAVVASPLRNNFSSIQAGVNANIAALSDGSDGQVLTAVDTDTVTYDYPPGYEFSNDTFTSAVNSTATTESGATTVKTSTSATFDGSAVIIEFSAAVLSSSVAGGGVWLSFFDGSTAIGKVRFGTDANGVASPGLVRVPYTPSAADHTFTVKIWATTASTVSAQAGAGGADTQLPGYIRITKA